MARSEAAGKTSVTGAIPSTSTGEVTIRKCEALAEMQSCFRLQKEVWGFADAELVPVRLFVVAAKIGGQVHLRHRQHCAAGHRAGQYHGGHDPGDWGDNLLAVDSHPGHVPRFEDK